MEILKNLAILHPEGGIVELRSIGPRPVISGYFRIDSPRIEAELARYPDRTFYQTMNCLDEACYSRDQHERLVANPKLTSNDNDFRAYQWLLIDSDPVRPTGVSATDAEKAEARSTSRRVWAYLKKLGFSDPVVADSGNGYHLLYAIRATFEDKATLERFLKVIDMWFSSETVKIDTTVFNPSRVTKLYGTVAHKGANTPDRPHRRSGILVAPPVIQPTSMALVERVASEFPKQEPGPGSRSAAPLDAESFLTSHGVRIKRKTPIAGGMKLVLEECPFDSSHKAPDSAVFVWDDGRLGFKCFHNSCADHGWHDLRQKLDPSAYATSAYTPQRYSSFPTLTPQAETPPPTAKRVLLYQEIADDDRSKIVVIKSRFQTLDAKIGGFNKGELSIWSGGNASGKSTLVSQLGLEAVHQGYKVILFSGEMTPSRVKYWLSLQAAGRDGVEIDPISPLHYRLREGIQERLNAFFGDRLAVYNNDFGNDWETVASAIFEWTRENHADYVIIDNLMALNIPVGSADKYDVQSQIVKTLSSMAKQLDVHVHFICHPRKSDGFLRKADISGTADLTNAADNVFMVHRVNADFLAKVRTVYSKVEIPAGVGNVVEVMKNRDMGVCDELVMLYFDPTCKTMSDVRGGLPMHSWAEMFTPVDDPDNPFLGGD